MGNCANTLPKTNTPTHTLQKSRLMWMHGAHHIKLHARTHTHTHTHTHTKYYILSKRNTLYTQTHTHKHTHLPLSCSMRLPQYHHSVVSLYLSISQSHLDY